MPLFFTPDLEKGFHEKMFASAKILFIFITLTVFEMKPEKGINILGFRKNWQESFRFRENYFKNDATCYLSFRVEKNCIFTETLLWIPDIGFTSIPII